jgi:hypothetical protein
MAVISLGFTDEFEENAAVKLRDERLFLRRRIADIQVITMQILKTDS